MKSHKTISFIILLFTLNIAYAQIKIPYLQDFENFSGTDEDDNFTVLVEGDEIQQIYYWKDDPDVILPINEANQCNVSKHTVIPDSIVVDAKYYSWDLDNTRTNGIGFCYKSTVHVDDHPRHAIPPRSRSETAVFLDSINRKETYLKYDLFIPNDNDEFNDEVVTIDPNNYICDISDDSHPDYKGLEYEMHKIFQLKSSSTFHANNLDSIKSIVYSEDPSVIIGMDYIHKETFNNKRDLYILITSPEFISEPNTCNPTPGTDTLYTRHRRMQIRDAITKGEWNEIIYKFYWSELDEGSDAGYYQVWINRKPVILDGNDPNPDCPAYIKYADLDDTGEPSKIYSGNIQIDPNFNDTNISVPMQNIFHFGQYRRNHQYTHTIYFDNIRVTSEFPPENDKTKLLPKYCDTTLQVDDMILECYKIPNNDGYVFEFRDYYTNNVLGEINSYTTTINLLDIGFLENWTKYNVRVRGSGRPFSDSCEITTPRSTKLESTYCDGNYDVGDALACYKLIGATSYVFRFKNNSNQYKWVTSTYNVISIPNIPFFSNGGNFEVHVREINHDYSDSCNIYINEPSGGGGKKNLSTISSLFPNPFNQYINLPNFDEEVVIQIFSPTGKLVFNDKIAKGTEKINLEYLSKGIYFVSIKTSYETIFSKIVKK